MCKLHWIFALKSQACPLRHVSYCQTRGRNFGTLRKYGILSLICNSISHVGAVATPCRRARYPVLVSRSRSAPYSRGLLFQRSELLFPSTASPHFRSYGGDRTTSVRPKFAATLLIVCSLGARFSDDPRVFLDNETVHRYHSAGWKWYNQVGLYPSAREDHSCAQIRVIPQNLIYKPDLYELQATALSALYLSALSPTVIGWSQIGFGLRRAQDVGAHRLRKQPHPTAENESWKRVFWVLLCLEWTSGTRSGRPIAMHEQEWV